MWFFNSPRIIFGREALEQLENPLHVSGSKALIVTDKDLVKLGIIDIVKKHLDNAGIEFTIFDGVLPDPPVTMVKEGAQVCKKYEPDLIIAVGGGSSIDAAKAIWVLYESGEEDFDISGLNPFIHIPTGTKAKLIAIPTTSGTGAETTSAVVLTDDETGVKLELLNRDATPTIAIVDPIFVDKMPKKLTSSTAFDAIAHCMEGMTGQWKNIYTEGLAVMSLKMIFENISKAYHESDPDAREAMHNAATIAGLSFGNAQAHLGHTIGHALGALFHVPHGFGVGIATPYVMKFLINNDDDSVEIFARVAKQTGVALWADESRVAAGKLLEKVKSIQADIEFPTVLPDIGITKEMFEGKLEQFMETVVQGGTITICPVNVDQNIAAKIVFYM
ncbi:MAG: iron-containing alcohol dehydrogenase, partial [Promethearchaeota archaeon]